MRRLLTLGLLLITQAALVAQSPAVYDFEAAPFLLNATTPFTNVAPASGGPGGFTASFTSAPTANAVQVFSGLFPEFGFINQSLIVPVGPETMTITFSSAVAGLSVNFAYNSGSANAPARFEAVVGANTYSSSGAILVGFPGGTLNFTDPTPFTSVDIRAFNDTGAQVEWAIDNLTLQFSAVPEPTTWALIGVVTLGTGAYGWKKRRKIIDKRLRISR